MPAKATTKPLEIAALRVGVPESCRLLGISRPLLYQRMKAGLLRPTKEGTKTLFTVAELQRYVNSTDPAAAPSDR
jgi:predicted DNA-binding transcriptional regulator AlpA